MGVYCPYNMEGIATVQIKMFDEMVWELKEVRYVNLISIDVLEALGHVVSVKNGVLKIIKGSMVMMKGVRRNNLY